MRKADLSGTGAAERERGRDAEGGIVATPSATATLGPEDRAGE